MKIDYLYFKTIYQKIDQQAVWKEDFWKDRNDPYEIDKRFKICAESEFGDPNIYLLWVIFVLNEFHDNEYSKEICEEWFNKFKDPLALIFLAFITDEYEAGISDELCELLKSVETVSARDQSIILMYLGKYYLTSASGRAIELLKKSVDLFEHNVHCLNILGYFFLKTGDKISAKNYHKLALSKVLKIYSMEITQTDLADYSSEEFIAEMILWSECTVPKYDYLKELISRSE